MSKVVLFFSLILFSHPLFTQIKFTQGDWTKRKTSASHQGFLFADSNCVYSIDFQNNRFSGKQYLSTNVFNKNTGEFIRTLPLLSNEDESAKKEMIEIFSLNHFFFAVSKKVLGNETIYTIQKINTNGIKLNTIEWTTPTVSSSLNAPYKIIVDKHENSFVIVQNQEGNSINSQQLIFRAFDVNLAALWSKTSSFPGNDRQFVFSEFRYDGQDNVYFIGRSIVDLYQPNIDFASLKQNTYFLFRYNAATEIQNEIELNLNDRFIVDIKTYLDESRWILCGSYSKNKTYRPDGIFNLQIDNSFQVVQQQIIDVSEISLESRSGTTNKKLKKNIFQVQLKEIITLKNGSFILLAEEFQKEWSDANDRQMNANNYTETFIYGNIFLFKFEEDGALKNSSVIKKRQVSINDDGAYSSFNASANQTDIFIFYNDNPKNTNSNAFDQNNAITGRKKYMKLVHLNKNGTSSYQALTSGSKSAKIESQKSGQLLDGRTYMLYIKRRKMALIWIDTTSL